MSVTPVNATPPYSHRYNLASVPDAGAEVQFSVPTEARAALAEAYGIESLDALEATLRLRRLSEDEYVLEGRIEAQLVQTCVVTLEPLKSKLTREIVRRYRSAPRRRGRQGDATAEPEDEDGDDEVETVSGSSIDLAGPVLEELSLGIDPYPRTPGAAFGPPESGEPAPEHPFALLEKLKPPPKPENG